MYMYRSTRRVLSVAFVVLCPSVRPSRPVVVVRPLSIRPVVSVPSAPSLSSVRASVPSSVPSSSSVLCPSVVIVSSLPSVPSFVHRRQSRYI